MLLYWYIPRQEWSEWLGYYDIEMDESLLKRMRWYVIAQTILSIQWHTTKQQAEAEYWHQYLQQLLASE